MAAFKSSVRKIFVICDVDDVTSKPAVVPLGDEIAGPITTLLLLLPDRDIHGVEVEFDGVIEDALFVAAGEVEIVFAVEFVAVMWCNDVLFVVDADDDEVVVLFVIWFKFKAASVPHRPRICNASAHFSRSGNPAWDTFTSPLYIKSTSACISHSLMSRGRMIMGCLHGFSPSKLSKYVEHAANTKRWQWTWWPSHASVTSTNRWPASSCKGKFNFICYSLQNK